MSFVSRAAPYYLLSHGSNPPYTRIFHTSVTKSIVITEIVYMQCDAMYMIVICRILTKGISVAMVVFDCCYSFNMDCPLSALLSKDR